MCAAQGDLKLEDTFNNSLSWPDGYQVTFRLMGPSNLCREERPIRKACAQRLMDSMSFLNALRDFPVSMEDLTSLWNGEVRRTIELLLSVRSLMMEARDLVCLLKISIQ